MDHPLGCGLYSFFLDPVSCPRCGGFGVYSHPVNECESVDCSDCDGSGVVENPAPSSAPVEDGGGAGGQPSLAPTFLPLYSVLTVREYFLMVDCPTCAGWGRVDAGSYPSAPFDRPCPTCTDRGFSPGQVPIAYIPPGSPLIPSPVPFQLEDGFEDEIPF